MKRGLLSGVVQRIGVSGSGSSPGRLRPHTEGSQGREEDPSVKRCGLASSDVDHSFTFYLVLKHRWQSAEMNR